jgi:signal transduction histidine kinase
MLAPQSLPANEANRSLSPLPHAPGASDPSRSNVPSAGVALAAALRQTRILRHQGLVHDARNLIGAIGLYCDLLSLPGALQPEYRSYLEELRLLGERSNALFDGLMASLSEDQLREGASVEGRSVEGVSVEGRSVEGRQGEDRLREDCARELQDSGCRREADAAAAESLAAPNPLAAAPVGGGGATSRPQRVNLRALVERLSGLLSGIAGGRRLQVEFGPAAALPVLVSEVAVERILVNLVRNAAAAVEAKGRWTGAATRPMVAAGTTALLRITVGMLEHRVGGPRAWPFQRVRLSVEDSGCGMTAAEVERLLGGANAVPGSMPGSVSISKTGHGIGFRVVRELVATSGGELRVTSDPRLGTRVEIEWPIAGLPEAEEAALRGEKPNRRDGGFGLQGRSRGRPAVARAALPARRTGVWNELQRAPSLEPVLQRNPDPTHLRNLQPPLQRNPEQMLQDNPEQTLQQPQEEGRC